jgi:hypothetical protein
MASLAATPESSREASSRKDKAMLAMAGTGYGLIGILFIILLVLMIIYVVRRA